jgi:NitT/TauT family transport system substrate-binding protein
VGEVNMNERCGDWNRRRFLGALTRTATAVGLLGLQAERVAAEPPLETTTIKIALSPSLCAAPQFVAEELLRSEGFVDVRYVKPATPALVWPELTSGAAHLTAGGFSGPFIMRIDAQDPVVLLGGIHTGCFELFGGEGVRAIRDLRGKSVAILARGGAGHVFLAAMAAHVGLDPRKDIKWVVHPAAEAKRLLAEGKVDAYLGFPPDPQELRAKKIGHVVVNSALDKPWSGYFCCTVGANREFVRKHPVATKRALRAILKAADICASEPEKVARLLVDRGHTPQYEYARQALREIPYARWREYDPEDTVRFYSLRLNEAGMIKSSPQKIIAQGTDWRFLNELKKELKG